ncbi:class I SAM-dependent methyltransferase [Yimella sp. cx-51]|uniref:class I SAM-dependent methyltransferase n=1 Tax=Yimella sp. cx-51 TaxID=2770551 RepID=UPI001FCBD1CE|nr:class I SAM-dependent methyltransferase [Yimella sp. cx-51]
MTDYQAIPSPNIWNHPEVYEIENRGVDPDGAIWEAMRSVTDWAGKRVLDIGCGTGFHLPLLAETAADVIGVEPHEPLVRTAQQRVAGMPTVDVRLGRAEMLPVEEASVDVMHNRWAYFFGRGCEPGLAELDRVMAPGGVAFVVDNDASRSRFGQWFRQALPTYDPVSIERFWDQQGWEKIPVMMRWQFASRADFEAVVAIEFDAQNTARILAEHEGTGVDYAVWVRWKRY